MMKRYRISAEKETFDDNDIIEELNNLGYEDVFLEEIKENDEGDKQ